MQRFAVIGNAVFLAYYTNHDQTVVRRVTIRRATNAPKRVPVSFKISALLIPKARIFPWKPLEFIAGYGQPSPVYREYPS